MKLKIIWFLLSVTLICSCTSLSKNSPYEVKGEVQSRKGGTAFEYTFHNKTEKAVSKIEFTLSLYDIDGEPVFSGDWITMERPVYVKGWEDTEDYFCIDEFLETEEGNLFTDYFYASKIWYEDGTFWEDPFGRFSE